MWELEFMVSREIFLLQGGPTAPVEKRITSPFPHTKKDFLENDEILFWNEEYSPLAYLVLSIMCLVPSHPCLKGIFGMFDVFSVISQLTDCARM